MISSLLLFLDPAEALFPAVAEVTDGLVFLALLVEHELDLDFAVILRDEIGRAERNQPEFRSLTTSVLILASRVGGLAVSSLPWAREGRADQENDTVNNMTINPATAFFELTMQASWAGFFVFSMYTRKL
jgi:hypothetical protein